MMETTEPPDAPQPRQDHRFTVPSTIVVLVDPDPHGSAYTWLSWMRIRIQWEGNCPKLTIKPDFQPFEKAFPPTYV